MGEPITSEVKLPLTIGLAEAAVDSLIKMLAQTPEGRRNEPVYTEGRETAKSLNREIADAKFEARMPTRVLRPGGEGVAVRGEVSS